ncbi:sulfatase, partial [Candidatus Woesearchaeota archaeon]|nr:sulfatase [Candidatus Woesearchaeota archaeon]
MKHKFKLTYFSYSLVFLILLSFVTTLVTILSPIFDLRLITTSTQYILLSITFFLSLSLITNLEKIKPSLNKRFFIVLTSIYSIGYLWSSLSFLTTNQIFRKQTALFLYKIYPKTFLLVVSLFILLVFESYIFLANKKIHFLKTKGKRLRLFEKITFVSFVLLILFMFVIPSSLKVTSPLIETYVEGNPIYIAPEEITSEKILNYKSELNKPNVIVILLESISDYRVGTYGYEREVTPNIDELADKSIVFENTYATATHSDYAQPAFLSSRYMLTNYYRNFFDVDHERKFIWEVFKDKGYYTTYFSSQDDRWAGMNNYFDFSALDIYSYSMTDGKFDYGSGLGKKDFDHKTLDKIEGWLDSYNADKPYFMYINLQATHTPMSYPKDYEVTYTPDNVFSVSFVSLTAKQNSINRFDNSLKYVDEQIGRLIDKLKERGEFENTAIILSSDHGHDFNNLHDVEGHGKSIYNEELTVPLIMYIPDLEPMRVKERVSHIDAMPTFLDLLNEPIPKEFIGKPAEKDARFFMYAQSHKNYIGMVKEDIKVIIDLNKNLIEVYNLEEDSLELKNLDNTNEYDQ